MKILVLDIETTGFSEKLDAIVEIGMILTDTDTKKYKIVFNTISIKFKAILTNTMLPHSTKALI